MTGPTDPREKAALKALLAALRMAMDGGDARSPHAVLITDPSTGLQQVVGPYPTRLEARIAGLLIKARNELADPELADVTYTPVLFIDAKDEGLLLGEPEPAPPTEKGSTA